MGRPCDCFCVVDDPSASSISAPSVSSASSGSPPYPPCIPKCPTFGTEEEAQFCEDNPTPDSLVLQWIQEAEEPEINGYTNCPDVVADKYRTIVGRQPFSGNSAICVSYYNAYSGVLSNCVTLPGFFGAPPREVCYPLIYRIWGSASVYCLPCGVLTGLQDCTAQVTYRWGLSVGYRMLEEDANSPGVNDQISGGIIPGTAGYSICRGAGFSNFCADLIPACQTPTRRSHSISNTRSRYNELFQSLTLTDFNWGSTPAYYGDRLAHPLVYCDGNYIGTEGYTSTFGPRAGETVYRLKQPFRPRDGSTPPNTPTPNYGAAQSWGVTTNGITCRGGRITGPPVLGQFPTLPNYRFYTVTAEV